MLEIIYNYFKIKQETKAKNLLETSMKTMTNGIESLKKEKKDEERQRNLKIKIYTLNELYRISNEFIPNDQITNELQSKVTKYMGLMND